LRHHRYETAYIQRRERGFFPVIAKTAEFSVCLERDDGSRAEKHYVMKDTSVRPAGEFPCVKTAEPAAVPEASVSHNTAKKSFTDEVKAKAKGLFGK
jgi:hypothetical protein